LKNQEKTANPINLKVIAIPDRFIGFAGTQQYLREVAGLKL
jgi:hypothetical protein